MQQLDILRYMLNQGIRVKGHNLGCSCKSSSRLGVMVRLRLQVWAPDLASRVVGWDKAPASHMLKCSPSPALASQGQGKGRKKGLCWFVHRVQ